MHLFVQAARLSDGSRRVTNITEVTGMEGEVVTLQDIFVFEKRGLTPEGHGDRAASPPPASGPSSTRSCSPAGIRLRADLFDEVVEV